MSKIFAIAELYDIFVLIACWGIMLYYLCMESIENPLAGNGQQRTNEKATGENSQEAILNEYKAELLNLQKILNNIYNLKWENPATYDSESPSYVPSTNLSHFRTQFFRYLNGKSDLLGNYINKIDGINTPDKIFSKEVQNSFLTVFEELFRLYAFSKVEFMKTQLSRIDFPFEEFEKSVETLKSTLKKGWGMEFVVPNLFVDNLKEHPEWQNNKAGTSNILMNYSSRIYKGLKSGTVIDFYKMGFHSDSLGINTKISVDIYT